MIKTETGLVLKEKRGLYTVETENDCIGHNIVICKAGSRLRKNGIRLCAGDKVQLEQNPDGSGFIKAALMRKNALARPPVANVDVCVIVLSVRDPAPSLYAVDKLTVMAQSCGIETAAVITKGDLACPGGLVSLYTAAGFRCFCVSAGKGDTRELSEYLAGKTSVFAGASGVGKSSLLNALFPRFKAKTGEISERIARGKNTTRHTEFFKVGENTYIADTPGFSVLDGHRVGVAEKWALAELFPDFAPFLGECAFRGCTHLKEQGCAVLRAVSDGTIAQSRHESYVRLYGEIGKT